MLLAPRQRRTRVAAVAVTVLVLAVVPTGCSRTSGAPDASATSPTAPSPSPGPSGPASPTTAGSTAPSAEPGVPEPPQPPAGGAGPKAQRAFARYVMAAWSWSLRSNDAEPLMTAGPSGTKPCDGCTALAEELARRSKEGWYVDFPGLEVERIRLRHQGPRVLATATVTVPRSDSVFDDGTYRSTSPAHKGVRFTVLMEPGRRGYRLLSFSLS